MTREIKFRHFGAHPYLETPSFIYLNLLACSANETLRFFRQGGCIEQYTGLKDKNNKEIYEGDIVESGMAMQCYGEVFYNPMYTRFMIRDEKRLLERCDCALWYTDDIEVLGNIHETPELLNV